MGYTHYWSRKQNLDLVKFADAVADCRKICSALPIPIGDSDGIGEPIFSDEVICFNGHKDSGRFSRDAGCTPWPTTMAQGVADSGTAARAGEWSAGSLLNSRAVNEKGDGTYEPFVVHRDIEAEPDRMNSQGMRQEFCKTAFRPYDLLVQCCLISLKEHLGDEFAVGSDSEDVQWNEARCACQEHLGYGVLFELEDWEQWWEKDATSGD